jgi:two-component system cell cycle response regulator
MKKILVIDQQPTSRLVLREALGKNHLVMEAASAEEAAEIAKTDHPDLIVLDMERPEGNGAAICAQLKESQLTRYVPLILLSPHKQKEDIINGLHAGAEDYMTKPINTNELLARIDSHLRTKKYYSELEKKDLVMLLELLEIISVTRNPNKILRYIVEKVAESIDVSRCSIISINNEGNLVVVASSDLPDDRVIELDLHKYPEIEKALSTQRPVVLQDISNNPLMEPVKEQVKGLADKALFVVPIIKKQNVIGTFFLRTSSPLKGGITDRVFKLCQVVANISGNALENAVLFEAMQSKKRLLEDLAVRDGLTKLYNHQYFHTRFEEEFSRAQRYNLSLSCVFIDIDDFKVVNDRYGHIAGDVVIKRIGRLVEQMLRKSDIAARYGGDEFALLLLNTEADGAHMFADRVLKMIRELSFQKFMGDIVTVSIGVATYSKKNLASYDELLHLADKAMYQAKQTGGGRVCQAEVAS